jgi:hypothetical protein
MPARAIAASRDRAAAARPQPAERARSGPEAVGREQSIAGRIRLRAADGDHGSTLVDEGDAIGQRRQHDVVDGVGGACWCSGDRIEQKSRGHAQQTGERTIDRRRGPRPVDDQDGAVRIETRRRRGDKRSRAARHQHVDAGDLAGAAQDHTRALDPPQGELVDLDLVGASGVGARVQGAPGVCLADQPERRLGGPQVSTKAIERARGERVAVRAGVAEIGGEVDDRG